MKRSKLKPISKTRSKALRQYAKARREYLAAFEVCEVCNRFFADEIHHMKGRGQMLCDMKYFLAVCKDCHFQITFNPKWAMEKGFSLDRLAR